MNKLLTIDEVAIILGKSPRTVKRLTKLEYSKVGGSRRYDERDVAKYLQEAKPCQSSCAKDRRTSTRSSKSTDIDFFEALARQPNVRPEPRSVG